MEEATTNKKAQIGRGNLFKFILLIFLVVAFIFSVKYFNLASYLNPESIRDLVDEFGVLGPIIFIITYALVTIAFVPGTVFSIASGAIFGTWLGTLYTVIGASIGATIAFFLSRGLGKKFVEHLLHHKFPTLGEYNKKLDQHGMSVTFFLRLVPIFPFNGLNYALGLTKVRAMSYIIATIFGIIPGSFALAYFGDSLAMLDIKNIIFSTLLFLALLAIYPIWKWWSKQNR